MTVVAYDGGPTLLMAVVHSSLAAHVWSSDVWVCSSGVWEEWICLPAVILVGNDGLRRPCDWVTVCLYMLSVQGVRRRSVSSDPLRVTLVGLGLPLFRSGAVGCALLCC